MTSRLQRPALPKRTTSASSFAETFSVARNKVDKDLADLEEQVSPGSDATDSTPALDLASSNASSAPSVASPISGPITPDPELDVADDFAFAFDIDGVLIRGGQPIPEAVEAMKILNGENEWGVRVFVSPPNTVSFLIITCQSLTSLLSDHTSS